MKAFPSTEPIYRDNVIGMKQSNGMDLRDYFAAQVLSCVVIDDTNIHGSATFCYKVADAMMEARDK
jgi:hypothetical protein